MIFTSCIVTLFALRRLGTDIWTMRLEPKLCTLCEFFLWKERRVKREKQPDWMTHEIHEAMDTRDNYAKSKDFDNWKLWRNKVTSMIRKSKREY